MQCPNKTHPDFIRLVEKYGENKAHYMWVMGDDLSPITTKPSFALMEYNAEKLFREEEKDLETGKYRSKTGEEYNSVTGDVIKSIQTRPFTSEDSYGVRAANRLFKNLAEDATLDIEGILGPATKQQYADFIDRKMNRGLAKGNILHAKIHGYVTKDAGVEKDIRDIMSEHNILSSEIDWLNPDAIRAIIRKTGTDYLNNGGTDKLYTEKVIGSTLLKWFGTVDMFVDHGNDLYSLFDLKTGLRFNKLFEDSFFKYGRTSIADVFDNSRNRAKLQLMLYAFIIKVEDPKARFRNLDVIHIRNQWSIAQEDPYKSVNVPAYLEIIKNTLKNEPQYKELYKKLEELDHFDALFSPESYTVVTPQDFGSVNNVGSSKDLIEAKMLELQGLIMYDSAVRDLNTLGSGEEQRLKIAENRERITVLMEEIIKLKKDPNVSMALSDINMGYVDRWLGSQSYSTNPYVQMYYKSLSTAKQASRAQYENWNVMHDKKLKALIEYKGLKAVSRIVGGVNRDKLFSFAYKTDMKNNIFKRLITSEDAEFSKLSSVEQDYLNFVNNSISAVFEKQHSALVDSKNTTPIAERIVTYRDWRGKKNVPVTNLNLHNKQFSLSNNLDENNTPFKYYKGFFPKFAPQIDDVAREHGSYFSKNVVRFLWNRYTTNYFETTFDQWQNQDEAIPMKYLGNKSIDENEHYTLNLELAVKSYMKHYIYKAHVDEVFTMGQAIRIYLNAKREEIAAGPDPDRVDHVDRLTEWFEDSVNLHVLGRKSIKMDVSSRPFGKIRNDRYEKFNWVKFLRSLKTFFAGPTMWLKPLSGLPNAVFATLVTLKEGIKGTFGIATSNAQFGLSDIAYGFKEAFNLFLWDGKSNEQFRSNKAYLLMEKFGYLPDNSDWYTSNNELMTARNQLFTSRTMMMFHSLPEETIATAIFIAQLRAMKYKNKDGVETNVWDSYEVVKKKLSDGQEYDVVDWVGGVRGVQNVSKLDGSPEYVNIEGLTIEEINAVKFLYEKIHGGYRADERIAAEYYVMGELFVQLKKYMPAILKNVWASRGIRQTQGYWKEVVDDNGVTIKKWNPQVIEGRYKTLLGLTLNYLSIKATQDGKTPNKFRQLLGLQYDVGQSWEQLSEAQKEDMKDFALTWSMYLLLMMGAAQLWDRDDDDTAKKIYERIANDFAGNVHPLELLKNVKNAFLPTAVNRGYQLLEGTAELTFSMLAYGAGYDDAALTREGNFRGAANVKRNIHFISAWYDVTSGIENSELFKEYLK